jgi:hypothetical protein
VFIFLTLHLLWLGQTAEDAFSHPGHAFINYNGNALLKN